MLPDQVDYGQLSRKALKFLKGLASETFQVPRKQVPRVLFHGLILAFIIAGFWLIDSLKDPVLSTIVGIEYQPLAKLLSVVSTLFVVCIYDFLTSLVTKPALFHIVATIFGLIMMIISALLSDANVGLNSSVAKGPHRMLGWFAYFCIEAYGSLMTALFWSFTNSLMDLEQAKGAYGLIIAIAQVGAILGSTLATNASDIGIPSLFIFGAMLIFSVSLLIKAYHVTYRDHTTVSNKSRVRSISENDTVEAMLSPSDHGSPNHLSPLTSPQSTHKSPSKLSPMLLSTEDIVDHPVPHIDPPIEDKSDLLQSCGRILGGFYEGLSLIVRYPYVLKLLGVSCLYEIIVTILDYEFKVRGAHASAHLHGSDSYDGAQDRFANLLGHFGQLTNIVSFCMSFFGFSYLVHHIGVDKSLMIFPCILFAAVIIIYLVPKLWVLFVFVSIIKGMVFSLHDPVKELLYIPTSESIKFKAKAWIDVFGSRFAKALGSLVTFFTMGDVNKLHSVAEVPILILAIAIIILTYNMGREFNSLVESNMIIGEPEGRLRMERREGDGPIIHGLRPGDVGYSGYDLELFDGVFEEEEFYTVGDLEMRERVEEGWKVNKGDISSIEPISIESMRQSNRIRAKSSQL